MCILYILNTYKLLTNVLTSCFVDKFKVRISSNMYHIKYLHIIARIGDIFTKYWHVELVHRWRAFMLFWSRKELINDVDPDHVSDPIQRGGCGRNFKLSDLP